jgi:hypothetical protein
MKGIILALVMIVALVDCSRADSPRSLELTPLSGETASSHRVVLTILQDDVVKGSQAGDQFAPQFGTMASVNMDHQQRQAKFVACYIPLEKSYFAKRSELQQNEQSPRSFYLLTGSDMSGARALEGELDEEAQDTVHGPKKPIVSPLQAGLASRPLALTEDGRIKIWTEADFAIGILYDPTTKVELATLSIKQGETQ